ncbi:DUF697 domain-containing protein [Granulibacter bethesdensis]|uniref:DUF697 domain-containing protein n=1 Tax=Granulibacter bethesdensis TaxID=364410 RepID=UPI000A78FF4F|nr:DUF697 domain-containing protein [Granulibacter bethesdensis]
MSDPATPRPIIAPIIAPRVETEGESPISASSSARLKEPVFTEPETPPFIAPRVETDHLPAERLEQALPSIPLNPGRGLGTLTLMASGIGLLGVGVVALLAVGFVMDQFARSTWLGGISLAVSLAGFGLLGAGFWREARGLFALKAVDEERAAILGQDVEAARKAARRWSRHARHGTEVLPAIEEAKSSAAIASLLRAGPVAALREESDALARAAAVQVFSATAAIPSPALDGFFVAWRGVRLVRQIAALHGMRPGLLGTLALLRRVTLSAAAVVTTDVALNAALQALGTHPLLRHVAGDMAGAGVAARRMLVLARVTAAACDPTQREK